MAGVLGVVIFKHDPGLWHAAWKPDFERIRGLLRAGDSRGGADGLRDGGVRDGHGADRETERDGAGGASDRADDGEHDVHDAVGNQFGGGGAGGAGDRAGGSGRAQRVRDGRRWGWAAA